MSIFLLPDLQQFRRFLALSPSVPGPCKISADFRSGEHISWLNLELCKPASRVFPANSGYGGCLWADGSWPTASLTYMPMLGYGNRTGTVGYRTNMERGVGIVGPASIPGQTRPV